MNLDELKEVCDNEDIWELIVVPRLATIPTRP